MDRELRRYGLVIDRLLSSMLVHGWNSRRDGDPKPGDLVMLSCAPPSAWHLSFYRERLPNDCHLLESVKTGEVCSWTNVGFHVIDEDKAGLSDRIRWTDAQLEFAEKFTKANRRADFHMNLPYIDRFDGELVHVCFRTRYGIDEIRTSVMPIRWQKVTIKALASDLLAGEISHVAARSAMKDQYISEREDKGA